MAKKVAPNSAVSSAPSTTPAGTGTTTTPASTHPVATVTPTTTTKKVNAAPAKNFEIVRNLWAYYKKDTPQRTKLIDVFMVFLMAVGVLQFLYCILAGNYVCICLYFLQYLGLGRLLSGSHSRGFLAAWLASSLLRMRSDYSHKTSFQWLRLHFNDRWNTANIFCLITAIQCVLVGLWSYSRPVCSYRFAIPIQHASG